MPRRINKNPNCILDLLTKVLLKAASGLARSALARRSGNKTNSVSIDFQSVRKLTNYIYAKLPKSPYLSHFSKVCYQL